MIEYDREIGKVAKTYLGIEDHGMFVAQVFLNFGDSGQAFNFVTTPDLTQEAIRGILKSCGVSKWEDLVGRTVYALRASGDRYGIIEGFAPLPNEPGQQWTRQELSYSEGS